MNINEEFRTFVNANQTVFLRIHLNASKTRTRFFYENRGHTLVENIMILTCAKIHRKILMFGEVGAPESSF